MKELHLPHLRTPNRRLGGVALALVAYAALTAVLYRGLDSSPPAPRAHSAPTARAEAPTPSAPPPRGVTLQGERFLVDGQPFFIKAVGYDPTRPGERPWERRFDAAETEADFTRIRAAGFNTLRTWAPLSAEELALAHRHGLRVLQGIWVPPDADFDDPALRRRVLGEVRGAVAASRWSPALLGYLVLNEPRARAVASAGLEDSLAFVREVVATVRALDPEAPIGYASWPGLEAFDDALLDFVAFNLYPHRPRVVMDELGLPGYLALLRRTVARGRPLLISEFGVSVSPERPADGTLRGGATEAEQAEELVALHRTFLAAGVTGTAVFQWNDGWWKNDEEAGDALTHNPADPEEWYGLVAFSGLEDRRGTPRPALESLTRHQRALLLEPHDGQVDWKHVPVRVATSEPLSLRVRVDGAAPFPVELRPSGNGEWVGQFPLAEGSVRCDVEFELVDARGEVVTRDRRLLRQGARREVALALEPGRLRVRPGSTFTLELELKGAGGAGQPVTLAAYTEDRYNEERHHTRTDARGRARMRLTAPTTQTLLTVLAFENDPALPPAERATAWAVVEVKEE